jgi:hypothetical protein
VEECLLILYISRKNGEANGNREEGFFKLFKSCKNTVRRIGRLWRIWKEQARWF